MEPGLVGAPQIRAHCRVWCWAPSQEGFPGAGRPGGAGARAHLPLRPQAAPASLLRLRTHQPPGDPPAPTHRRECSLAPEPGPRSPANCGAGIPGVATLSAQKIDLRFEGPAERPRGRISVCGERLGKGGPSSEAEGKSRIFSLPDPKRASQGSRRGTDNPFSHTCSGISVVFHWEESRIQGWCGAELVVT